MVAAIDAGALEFEVVGFDVARFDVARFGVSDEPLLVAMLLPVLLVVLSVRLLAIANPASGALADCAVAVVASVVASEERDRAGALSRAELDVGDGSAAEKLRSAELTALGSIGAGLIGAESIGADRSGAKSTGGEWPGAKSIGAELPGAESPTLESLDWGAAGCLAVAGSVRGARLFSLTGDCSVGIGDGVGVSAGIGAEDACETILETGLVEGTGPWPRAGKATGWSEELLRTEVRTELRTEDGSAFVSGVAGVGSAGLNEAAGADGDSTVGDWSSAKIVAPAAVGVGNWLSAGMNAGETAVVAETGTGDVEESAVVDVDEPSVGKAVVGETGVNETGVSETGVSEARSARVGKTGASETSVDKTGVGETRTVGTGETGARSVENCAGAAASCVEALRNDGAASEAA